MSNSDLLRFNYKDKKFLVFDWETEGLNLKFSRGWELAFIIYQNDKELERHHFYLKWPNLKVSPGAAMVTGFKQENIDKKGKNPKEVLDFFDNYLYNDEYYPVAHNGLSFDIFIHNSARLLLEKESDYSYLNRFYDTNALSKGFKLNRQFNKNYNFLAYQYSLLNHLQKGLKSSITTMCKDLEIPFDEVKLHHAGYDCEKTYDIFKQLMFKMDI